MKEAESKLAGRQNGGSMVGQMCRKRFESEVRGVKKKSEDLERRSVSQCSQAQTIEGTQPSSI